MKKLFKIYRKISKLAYDYVYHIVTLVTIYAVIISDYVMLLNIAVLALIAIAIELRDNKDSSKIERAIKWFDKMMDEKKHKESKKCDLNTTPDQCIKGICKECDYYN